MASPLRIIAQPKASRRERYFSEQDSGRQRAHRYIRAENNPDRFDHPTVEIPDQWNKPGLYIRITLVTVPSEQAPVVCIHPYPIRTNEAGVITDAQRNTLFFPVSEAEITKGQKSFRITLDKLVQYELRNCQKLSRLHGDQMDIQRVNDPIDARKLIETYQLGKSQLVFSMAQMIQAGIYPVIYDSTSVYSNVMTASSPTSSSDDDSLIRYAPQQGDWQGGDVIIMVIPKLDRRKSCEVYLEHPSTDQPISIPKHAVDTKTISFKTPPCPIPATENQTTEAAIIVKQKGEEIARVNFCYRSCDLCISCRRTTIFDDLDRADVYERSSGLDLCFDENDNIMFTDESS